MKRHYAALGYRLPTLLARPLFGDRCRFGLEVRKDDPDWQEWQKFYLRFYENTQKQGIGKIVNDAGYEILRRIDLTDKEVLEIGPGNLPHLRFWNGKPSHYTVVDVSHDFIDLTMEVLKQEAVTASSYVSTVDDLPLKNESVDVLLSFYSLEHLHPLERYLAQFKRVLRPGGLLVGAIPCEGGLAWGGGRFITSRRYIKSNSSINPDKIICWEHPYYADHLLRTLADFFESVRIRFWPFRVPWIDFNLICNFIYRNRVPTTE
jgi:SAM-dependent methyltransferase